MGVLDWIIVVAAVLLMVGQGWWVSAGQKTTEDYFVGGRRMNWLAVGLAMFATTFSPLSFVGQPREAAYDNYHLYLAILFIPLFVVPVVAWLFVPLYHRLRLTSAYEYLERRFDRRLRLEHNKFEMFDTRLDLTVRNTFFSACAFGMFVYLSTAVTSQGAIQRYASTPTVGAARRLLAVHGIGTAVVCLMFFLLGSSMF